MSAPHEITMLHISDLHINASNMDFHNILLDFLIKNFNHKINYLLLTGDFGDHAAPDNVRKAKEWLKRLRQELNVSKERAILCPGNHDLNQDSLPEKHEINRLRFKTAKDYLKDATTCDGDKNKFCDRQVFAPFNEILNEVREGLEQKVCIDTGEGIRFVVLNSSRLSTTRKSEIERILKATGEFTDEKNLVASYEKEYGLVCGDFKKDKDGKVDLVKSLPKRTLNYSENIKQQLGLKANDIKTLSNNHSDDLSIVLFHHPEQCLHAFEHLEIPFVSPEDNYSEIVKCGSLLICGHIHPDKHIGVSSYTKLPMFIGGAAHQPPPNTTKANDKEDKFANIINSGKSAPNFYLYKFSKLGDVWDVSQTYFVYNDEAHRFIQQTASEVKIPNVKRGMGVDWSAYSDLIDENIFDIQSEDDFNFLLNHTSKWLEKYYKYLLERAFFGTFSVDIRERWIKYDPSRDTNKKRVTYSIFKSPDLAVILNIIPVQALNNSTYSFSRITDAIKLAEEDNAINISLFFDIATPMISKDRRKDHMENNLGLIKEIFDNTTDYKPVYENFRGRGFLSENFAAQLLMSKQLFFSGNVLQSISKNIPAEDIFAQLDSDFHFERKPILKLA